MPKLFEPFWTYLQESDGRIIPFYGGCGECATPKMTAFNQAVNNYPKRRIDTMKKTIKKSGGARQGAGRPPGSKTVNRKVPRNTREKIAYFRTTQTAYLRLVEVSSSCNQTVSRFVGDMIEKHFEG